MSSYSHDELLRALYMFDDMMDRAQIPYFLLEDTAEQVQKGQLLEGSALHVGVMKKDLTRFGLEVLDLLKFEKSDNARTTVFEFNGVSVLMRKFKRANSTFLNPDVVFYQHEFFRIPNPFDYYLKTKNKLI